MEWKTGDRFILNSITEATYSEGIPLHFIGRTLIIHEVNTAGNYVNCHDDDDEYWSVAFCDMQPLTEEYIEEERKALEDVAHYYECIESLIETIYPGNWSLNKLDGILYIRFPEIEITNGRHKHKIIDMFVKIKFKVDKGKLIMSAIDGGRMSMTWKEYCSHYTFSHLSVGTLGTFSYFCFGSGSIAATVADLRYKFTLDKFEILLYELSIYLSWESISGGPYRRIENISDRAASIPTPSDTDIATSYKRFVEECTKVGFKINLSTDIHEIGINIESIKPIVDRVATMKCRYLSDTNTYAPIVAPGSLTRLAKDIRKANEEAASKVIEFRGEKIYPKVIDEVVQKDETVDETDLVAHPEIMDHIQHNLNELLKTIVSK